MLSKADVRGIEGTLQLIPFDLLPTLVALGGSAELARLACVCRSLRDELDARKDELWQRVASWTRDAALRKGLSVRDCAIAACQLSRGEDAVPCKVFDIEMLSVLEAQAGGRVVSFDMTHDTHGGDTVHATICRPFSSHARYFRRSAHRNHGEAFFVIAAGDIEQAVIPDQTVDSLGLYGPLQIARPLNAEVRANVVLELRAEVGGDDDGGAWDVVDLPIGEGRRIVWVWQNTLHPADTKACVLDQANQLVALLPVCFSDHFDCEISPFFCVFNPACPHLVACKPDGGELTVCSLAVPRGSIAKVVGAQPLQEDCWNMSSSNSYGMLRDGCIAAVSLIGLTVFKPQSNATNTGLVVANHLDFKPLFARQRGTPDQYSLRYARFRDLYDRPKNNLSDEEREELGALLDSDNSWGEDDSSIRHSVRPTLHIAPDNSMLVLDACALRCAVSTLDMEAVNVDFPDYFCGLAHKKVPFSADGMMMVVALETDEGVVFEFLSLQTGKSVREMVLPFFPRRRPVFDVYSRGVLATIEGRERSVFALLVVNA